jgi:predicted secreted protein
MSRSRPMRSRLLTFGVTSIVVALSLVVAACGDDADQTGVAITEPGTSFEVEVGERFTIVLESNITTGYAWSLETEPPVDVVRLVEDRYVEPDTDLAGAPGHQELTFEAVGDGTASIELWYVRSFQDPPDPADRARFAVIVGTR